MSTSEPEDVWTSRDLVALRAIVKLRDQRPGRAITSHEVSEATGFEHDRTLAALQNLLTTYIDGRDAGSMAHWDVLVVGVTEEGLRAVGAWPSPESAATRLIAALDEQIDHLPEGSPKSNKLKQARDALLGVGRDILVDVAGSVLTGRIPM